MVAMRYKLFILISVFIIGCDQKKENSKGDWCDQAIRPEFEKLEEIKVKSNWFKVFVVGENVFSIAEPYNYEEVISYLILGKEKALLFDTGNGFDSMSELVKELTDLPVVVINSHTHYDHIGGNYEFNNILALNNEYTLKWAELGWSHELVKNEITPEAICSEKLPGTDISNHYIKPFTISEFITDGQIIDLGERQIKILSVPGHTPDAIALLDQESGYLWTGDTFYEAAIWLYFDGTDLNDYEKSIRKLADLTPSLKKLFTAHNTPISQPNRLKELVDAFSQILNGEKKAKEFDDRYELPSDNDPIEYEFEHFSFLIRRDHLKMNGII
jgi:glyoxylase-like metal-dependent hydrolase (beta-lactamase superfamily II)